MAMLKVPMERLNKIISSREQDAELNNLYGYVEQNPIVHLDAYGLGSEGTPGNNQAQNKQFNDICRELKLNKDQKRLLHDEISGQNYGYHDIRNLALELFKP